MRWILALMLCLLPLADVRAGGPDDQFVELYSLIQQADGLNQSGQTAAAAEKYQKVQSGLKVLQGGFPNWNKDVVQFRLDYVTEKLGAISKGVPRPVPVVKPMLSAAELDRQVNDLEEQVRVLSGEKISLERKLKESLSLQPAAINPQELAKAEARITALQKEKDLLRVSWEQEKFARIQAEKGQKGAPDSELTSLKAKAKKADELARERDDLRDKLAESTKEVSALKARHVETPKSNEAELAGLRTKAKKADDLAKERDDLRGKLAESTKEIAALHKLNLEPPKPDAELASLRAKVKEADAVADERAALSRKLAEANKEIGVLKALSPEPPKSASDAELASLKEANAATQKKLEEARHDLDTLKKSRREEIRRAEEAKTKDFNAELARSKEDTAATELKLEETRRELDTLKASRREEIRQAKDGKTKDFTAERDELKVKLAAATKSQADAEARSNDEVKAARSELAQYKKAAKERDTLADKLKITEAELASLKAAPPKVKNQSAPVSTEANKQVAQLQARLAVLEANPVPYTAEELALFKKPASKITSEPPTAPKPSGVVHSMKDLPPGAGALMADAQRAFQARDYAKAEKKYKEVLQQDTQNVYVLAHLANAQFANGQAEECEKTVREVIALDPNDPAGLYLMGNLRLRQGKLDEALDALSRSAQINPTNSVTQNSLGTVLSQKGQRKAAETALRKALLNDPDYADAHHNLAIVYITENPPALELARFHYKKAVDLGHPKDSDLEKLLEEKK